MTPTPLHSPTPSGTPTPLPTLPFPALDYPQILDDLSERYMVIGDIKNSYGSGMLDQWRKVEAGEVVSPTLCVALSEWPVAFSLTPEQQAILDAPGVADPALEEAIRLQADALALALEARMLYERDCPGGTLNVSMIRGISLSEDALSKFQASQMLVEEIYDRPNE
jgi:hypothetical protein